MNSKPKLTKTKRKLTKNFVKIYALVRKITALDFFDFFEKNMFIFFCFLIFFVKNRTSKLPPFNAKLPSFNAKLPSFNAKFLSLCFGRFFIFFRAEKKFGAKKKKKKKKNPKRKTNTRRQYSYTFLVARRPEPLNSIFVKLMSLVFR